MLYINVLLLTILLSLKDEKRFGLEDVPLTCLADRLKNLIINWMFVCKDVLRKGGCQKNHKINSQPPKPLKTKNTYYTPSPPPPSKDKSNDIRQISKHCQIIPVAIKNTIKIAVTMISHFHVGYFCSLVCQSELQRFIYFSMDVVILVFV